MKAHEQLEDRENINDFHRPVPFENDEEGRHSYKIIFLSNPDFSSSERWKLGLTAYGVRL